MRESAIEKWLRASRERPKRGSASSLSLYQMHKIAVRSILQTGEGGPRECVKVQVEHTVELELYSRTLSCSNHLFIKVLFCLLAERLQYPL